MLSGGRNKTAYFDFKENASLHYILRFMRYEIYYVIQNGFFSHLYKTKLVKKFIFISKHLTSGKYTSSIERLVHFSYNMTE